MRCPPWVQRDDGARRCGVWPPYQVPMASRAHAVPMGSTRLAPCERVVTTTGYRGVPTRLLSPSAFGCPKRERVLPTRWLPLTHPARRRVRRERGARRSLLPCAQGSRACKAHKGAPGGMVRAQLPPHEGVCPRIDSLAAGLALAVLASCAQTQGPPANPAGQSIEAPSAPDLSPGQIATHRLWTPLDRMEAPEIEHTPSPGTLWIPSAEHPSSSDVADTVPESAAQAPVSLPADGPAPAAE